MLHHNNRTNNIVKDTVETSDFPTSAEDLGQTTACGGFSHYLRRLLLAMVGSEMLVDQKLELVTKGGTLGEKTLELFGPEFRYLAVVLVVAVGFLGHLGKSGEHIFADSTPHDNEVHQ